MTKDFDKKLFKVIFDSYFKHSNSNKNLILWLCELLIRLMNILKATQNKELIKDALIILLNLLNDTPLDRYESNGKNLKEMTSNHRRDAKYLLEKVWDFN